jgi:hypothetical protein
MVHSKKIKTNEAKINRTTRTGIGLTLILLQTP